MMHRRNADGVEFSDVTRDRATKIPCQLNVSENIMQTQLQCISSHVHVTTLRAVILIESYNACHRARVLIDFGISLIVL